MKKLFLLTKTLLVAAGLLVGTNAWADDEYTTIYQRTSAEGTNQWAAADVTAWGSAANLAIQASTNYFGFDNVVGDVSYTISPKTYSKVKFQVEWFTKCTTNDYATYCILKLGSLALRVRDSYQNNCIAFSTDGGATFETEQSTKNTAKWVRSGNIVTVTAILNTATNVIESLSVVIDGKTYTTSDLGSTSITSANSIGLKTTTVRASGANYTGTSLIKSIVVSECEQEVTEADYTINYQLNSTTVKTVSSKGTVGQVITADAVINGTEAGYEGNHYLITAASAPSMTLVAAAASNVLNVPVRAPYTATLNVTRTIGGVAETPVVTNLTETDAKVCSWVYTYPMYVQKDGVYYVADVTTSFGESGTFTDGQTINKTVAYTNPDYSVVYFGEPQETTGTNTAYSNGATGCIKGGVTYSSNDVIRLGQLAAGTYRLITNVTGAANRNVVVGDYTAGTASFPTSLVTIDTTGEKDESFTVDGTQLICISGKDQSGGKFNQSADVDYILVKASSASATIGSTGWTTFASPYALDLSSMTASTGVVAAYYASTVNASTVTMTSTTATVAAGTGIMLKGTADATITIPVAASGDAISGNKLVGCTSETVLSANENYYVLVNNDGAEFQRLDVNGATIPAGKAYLNTGASSARSLRIVFAGDITGISEAAQATEAAEKDGKFVENGQLVIKKNGKKFNAAGAQMK